MTQPAVKKSSTKKIPKELHDDPKRNYILAALPDADFERLLPDLEFVPMPLGWTMSESGDHVEFLHFPTTGIVSLIHDLEDGSSSEIALACECYSSVKAEHDRRLPQPKDTAATA